MKEGGKVRKKEREEGRKSKGGREGEEAGRDERESEK